MLQAARLALQLGVLCRALAWAVLWSCRLAGVRLAAMLRLRVAAAAQALVVRSLCWRATRLLVLAVRCRLRLAVRRAAARLVA